MTQFLKLSDNDLRKLIPSKDAVVQHANRAILQAGFIWREADTDVCLPDPTTLGWRLQNGQYLPKWQSKDSGVEGLVALTTVCSCRTAKCKSCKCAKNKLNCLPMCGCSQKCLTRN